MAAARSDRMQPRERCMYEVEAQKEKERNLFLQNKCTTQGKSYAQIRREMSEAIERENKMVEEIEFTVRSLDRSSSLLSYKFYVIHVNYYCRLENGTFLPCELGLVEFSLLDGITKTYHTLINPGGIPMGYNYQAKKYSEDTHSIPVPPDEFGGESNHPKILEKVKQFVMGEKGLVPPLYTALNTIEPVKNILWRFQKFVDPGLTPDENMFAVYSLPKLFYELSIASASSSGAGGFRYYSLAERELEKDVLSFTKGISCNFHEKTDALPYCSLSCARRWIFVILKHCCKNLEIKMLPDRHYARNSSQFQRPDFKRKEAFLNSPCDYPFLGDEVHCDKELKSTGNKVHSMFTPDVKSKTLSTSQVSSGDTFTSHAGEQSAKLSSTCKEEREQSSMIASTSTNISSAKNSTNADARGTVPKEERLTPLRRPKSLPVALTVMYESDSSLIQPELTPEVP
ncbi:protein maelstrom homolog [Periplaneta americana]|uniref:protein maelstrom homolog n=1 Tax=Periplaneta americana TaxID=6978 RepID=UPI0037E9210F